MTKIADFDRFEIAPGFDLFVLPTSKFKTIFVKAYVHRTLAADEATANALLPCVLRRGCRGAPDMRKMVLFLEDLYGASLSADIGKLGERHVMTFSMDFVNDRFAPGRARTLRRGLKFLSDMMLRPVRTKGGLRPDFLEQEKENLRRFIEGRINDRASFAHDRCVEEMCSGEPYGTYEYGSVERIPQVGPRDLRELHDRVMATAPIHLFVTGDVRPKRVASIVSEHFRLRRRKVEAPPDPVRPEGPEEPREIVERREVEQGNLVLGCRSGVSWKDPEIFAAVFANAVLGGYAHSKLFVHLREEKGLAYSAGASFEKTKGLVFVSAGIDFAKYGDALRTIRELMADVAEGRISDEEFGKTRESLLAGLRSREDSPGAKIASLEEQMVNGRSLTTEEMIAGVERIAPEDVSAAARKVRPDTVYFLTRANGEER
ncbi:MAG: EF-P 5-aminopentanol modification-associated protein YfmF [Planctomycetota bacterium]|jgi:predicted Zn-dependent peptidase